ncbi:MAG TPA: M20/M25/M40 family metallo-hydrolase [Polyangiaceae bacterium]|nr:M20/M25/M40 family metallo-hydrolase [Polyangiaceae bacterium]
MSHSAAVRYLRDYVAIPSVNPLGRTDIDPALLYEDRYAERVQQQLQKLGVNAVLVGTAPRRSVVAEVRAARATETLLVASHLDTVPVDHMSIDPFDPVVKDGRLFGRGSCDTKAGMAALLAALERVLARGSLARHLVIVGEADEESSGSIGVADTLAHLEGTRIDWAIATEPTELRLVNAHKGTAVVRVEARGRACHSSDPSRGENAIVALAHAVLGVHALGAQLAQHPHPVLGPATLSIGLVGGGNAPNIVPDRAWFALDRRTLPGDTSESLSAEIEAALRAAGQGSVGAGSVTVGEVRMGKQPLFTPDTSPGLVACRRALERVRCNTDLRTVAFGTDAGLLAGAGIPSVVLGPGSIDRAHTADEYVEVDQLERMVHIYEQILEGA